MSIFTKKIRYFTKILMVNLLVLGLGILGIELIFGGWIQSNEINRLNLLIDITRRVKTAELYPSDHEYTIYRRDKYGLRGAYGSPEDIKILTVGGSTTDQRYITEGETWQDVMVREFQDRGREMTVVNAGVDGQSTYGHLKDFDLWWPLIPGLQPDYLLFYIGINDSFREENDRGDRMLDSAPVLSIIRQRSAMFRLYEKGKGIYRAFSLGHRRRNFSRFTWVDTPNIDHHDLFLRQRLENYRQRVEELMQRTKAMGSIPICVTQASWMYHKNEDGLFGISKLMSLDDRKINGVDYFFVLDSLNQVTLQVCTEAGGIGIDLAKDLEWEEADFYDFFHNTPRGARKIGQYLYGQLEHID